jgi:general L-amino acid transport system permease protein
MGSSIDEPIDLPQSSPLIRWRRWTRDNLFATPGHTILTLTAGAVVVVFTRAMLGFVFSATRWEAVATNLRLLMTHDYPVDRYVRIWVSVGIVVALTGLSLAVWRAGRRITVRRLGRGMQTAGALFGFFGIVGVGKMPGVWTAFLLLAAGLLWLGGSALGRAFRPETTVPSLAVAAALMWLGLLVMWTAPIGRYGYADNQFIADPGTTIALSTKLPWTILAVVLVTAYWVGRWLRDHTRAARRLLTVGWVLSVPVIVLVIMRAPDLGDWELGRDLAILAVAIAGGGPLLLALSHPRSGGAGLVAALAAGALAFWPGSVLIIIRVVALVFVGFALAASSVTGEWRGRLRYSLAWCLTIAPVMFLVAMIDATPTIGLESEAFLGGLALTLVIAVAGITISFPLGVMLALARTSSMPVFRLLSTAYIELIRGIPLLVLLLFANHLLRVLLPEGLSLDDVVRAIVAVSLYFAAYMAENVRGGLQAVPIGHYEASRSLGMNALQINFFIVLPQALRAVLPALVGQAITIFKETTLVSIIGLWDLTFIASKVVPQQTAFLGAMRENLLFIALVYWLFTFSFSRSSLRLERRLGLGEQTHYGAL